MLAVILVFCDHARTYAPFLWLTMLKRGDNARGCVHFFCVFIGLLPFIQNAIFLCLWLGLRSPRKH